jgi:hypothetical protein
MRPQSRIAHSALTPYFMPKERIRPWSGFDIPRPTWSRTPANVKSGAPWKPIFAGGLVIEHSQNVVTKAE